MRLLEAETAPVPLLERTLLPGRGRADRTRRQLERLAADLRRQGFIARVHLLQRFVKRARVLGIRFEPVRFGREFLGARHYRLSRPGYHNRIAVVWGMPIVYRMGGPSGRYVVLIGVLPRDAVPPVAPAPAPQRPPVREAESELAFDDSGVRTACAQARARMEAVSTAAGTPEESTVLRHAMRWLVDEVNSWGPDRLRGLTDADIDRLVTCLVRLEGMTVPRLWDVTHRREVTRLRRNAARELARRRRP